jgi:ADP-ribose pyrophosphatase YjhB (NUDIX family)
VNRRPRVIAICLFRRDDRILVTEVPDEDRVRGYRPLGGGVEWGERTHEAVTREIREELGVELLAPRLITVLENLFTHRGESGHEIVFVYDGTASDPALYDREPFVYLENDAPARARWMRLAEFGPSAPLYPDGLLDVLMRS